MGSNISSNGTHTTTIEPMLSAFESELPIGSTIKRKPSVMQPKIPLTNTTRYLALQSDDALVEVVNSSSSDASSLSSSEVSSLSGGYGQSHHHNHHTTNSHQQICGTLKSGTLRRSATDERLKTRIYEPLLQKRYQNIDNNNGCVNYNHSVKLSDRCPPSTDKFELINNGVVVDAECDTLIDSLPLPPPPQVLTNSLSTLSLNWLPPPPAEVLRSPSPPTTDPMSSVSSQMSLTDSLTPKASPVMMKTSPSVSASRTPQIAPKPKLLRRLSETAYDRPIYINGFKKGSSLTLQKLLKYFKRSLSLQNNKPVVVMDLKSVSCYATLPRTTKARPPVNNLVKKLCPQSSNTSPSIIESRTHNNSDNFTTATTIATTPSKMRQMSPNHMQKYSTITSPKHYSRIQQQKQQQQQQQQQQQHNQQQLQQQCNAQQQQQADNLYQNKPLEQLLAEFESEYQILEQQIQSYNTPTNTTTSTTNTNITNNSNNKVINNSVNSSAPSGAPSCAPLGAPSQANSVNVMSYELQNYNNMDQTTMQSQIYYMRSQHTNYCNGLPIVTQQQPQQYYEQPPQQCYQQPPHTAQPMPQQLPPTIPPHSSQYQSYESQLQSQLAMRHMSQTQYQSSPQQHFNPIHHQQQQQQQTQQQLENQYLQRIYESNHSHVSNPYHSQSTQPNMCAINNQTYIKSKVVYSPQSSPCARSPMKGPLPTPPETFLREIQRVMEKKWKVAQTLSTDLSATPNQILGFRDAVYLPPNGANSSNIYDTVATQRPHVKSVRISSNVSEIAVNGKHRRMPPPPPKRSVTTQLSHNT